MWQSICCQGGGSADGAPADKNSVSGCRAAELTTLETVVAGVAAVDPSTQTASVASLQSSW